MKITELVTKLNMIKNVAGDIEVMIVSNCLIDSIGDVYPVNVEHEDGIYTTEVNIASTEIVEDR